MSSKNQCWVNRSAILPAAALFLSPLATLGQGTAPAKPAQATSSTAQTAKGDRWLHVRVVSTDAKGDIVRVNIPLEMAEKVLPAVNHDPLRGGRVKIDSARTDDVDLKTLLEAVRTAKDGEYVTVQSRENDVRVAKEGSYLNIHVVEKDVEKGTKRSQVEVKVPMKVVDALLSAGKDELDLVAALHALGAQGDTELVSVKDSDNTIKVWLDSKNVSD